MKLQIIYRLQRNTKNENQLIKDVSIATGTQHTSLTYVEFHKKKPLFFFSRAHGKQNNKYKKKYK